MGKTRKIALALAAAGGLAVSLPAPAANAASGDRVIWTNGSTDVQFAAGDCVADGTFHYTTAHAHPNVMYASIGKVSGPSWCRFAVDMTYRDQGDNFVNAGEQVSASRATVTGLGTRCSVRLSIQRPGDGWFTVYLNNITTCTA
ncbi:hypothetical protein [Streptomyces sp. CBMA156]|uniref:hypothetical protein n=1 Tax=Streptomyces sp. CBMA156 TaxID=1930280 RepID=UPI00166205A4|nr:hypothetical protein [Streptomyces sp. CBMA156]MBD0675478.1 hypothetical protein [Streptomyces sp. CBMA156]